MKKAFIAALLGGAMLAGSSEKLMRYDTDICAEKIVQSCSMR